MTPILNHFFSTEGQGRDTAEANIQLAHLASLVSTIVFSIFSATALISLHPINATLYLGCAYISYEMNLAAREIAKLIIDRRQSKLEERDLSRLTRNAPVLHTIHKIANNMWIEANNLWAELTH